MKRPVQPVREEAILILTDDRFPRITRISQFLGQACKRAGLRAFVRDTADEHWLNQFNTKHQLKESGDLGRILVSSKFAPFVQYAGIDIILSLNMHWVFPPETFVSLELVKNIVSLWLNDVPSLETGIEFSPERSLAEILRAEKVHHRWTSSARVQKARELQLSDSESFLPAAPAEYLEVERPCQHRDRIAFLGNPAEHSCKTIAGLHQNGVLDVYGAPENWSAHGVSAKPFPKTCEMEDFYTAYPAYLIWPDAASGETIHEQPFEAGACGRTFFHPDTPEIRKAFSDENEFIRFDSAEPLEPLISRWLAEPDSLLQKGQAVRQRVAKEHTWDHRLPAVLKEWL